MSGTGRVVSEDGRFDLGELLREASLERDPGGERTVSQEDISALFPGRRKRTKAGPESDDA